MKKVFKFGCFSFIGLVVLIIIIAVATSGGGSSDKASTEPQKEKDSGDKKDEKVISVGDTAKIADVAFKVKSVDTKTKIDSGNQFVDPAKASGKFVIMKVSIKNGQKESLTINSDYFKIKTKDGTTYDPTTDSDVMMVVSPDKQFFLEQINPGIKKNGTIVFDVPKDLKLSKSYLKAQTGFWGTETVKIQLGK